MAHGPRKKRLDFGDKPHRVSVRQDYGYGAVEPSHIPQQWVWFFTSLFNSNNFALSAVLANVCALLSANFVIKRQ